MRYAVVIEGADATTRPMCPICRGAIATAATLAEVEQEIRAAIRFHIEGLEEDGLPVPLPSSVVEYVEA